MDAQDKELLSLINACLKGNEDAWHLFINQYGKIVRGCLSGYFRGDTQKIDEVTQQVCIKLWKAGLRDFRGTNRYQFLSYLKLITVNEAKTYLRLTTVRTREASINQDPPSRDKPAPATDIPSGTPNPEQTTSARERLEILTNHLHDLPLEQQQIFLMKAKGYKEKEISELLGIPEGTVASSYSRTLAKLKIAIGHG
jgi:RNA polymerase sigma factor (sigma-70 family)